MSCKGLPRHRLKGHRDQITNIRFISKYPSSTPSTSTNPTSWLLISSSKDTFLKLWDLSTQHCVQTVVAHRAEVWSLSLNSEQDLLLTGSNEGELKAWKLEPGALMDGIKESENGEVWHIFECSEILLTRPFTALESDPPYIDPPSRFTLSCLSDRISPHTSIPFCPVKRALRRGFPCAV